MQAWPPATRAAGRAYFLSNGDRTNRSRSADHHYWLHLPRWLLARAGSRDPTLLDDILWGQYCLFLFIRIQDDVLDRQAPSARLLFVANEFLLEAERTFARTVGHRAFSEYFRGTIADSSRAILAADALQRRRVASVAALTATYRRVSAVFKAGSAAVCLAHDDPAALAHVERFADDLAVAGQLIDDLEDMEADLDDGRLNAAARLLAPDASPQERGAREILRRAVINGQRLPRLFALIKDRLRSARAAIAPVDLPDAGPYLDRIDGEVDALQRAVHHARVRAVFQSVPGTGPARPAS